MVSNAIKFIAKPIYNEDGFWGSPQSPLLSALIGLIPSAVAIQPEGAAFGHLSAPAVGLVTGLSIIAIQNTAEAILPLEIKDRHVLIGAAAGLLIGCAIGAGMTAFSATANSLVQPATQDTHKTSIIKAAAPELPSTRINKTAYRVIIDGNRAEIAAGPM